jgi:proteasome lid subunit RPN8/RPN11
MEVHLSEMAFTGMIIAALESYRKESFGLLLGQRIKEGLVVQHAVPYQTADRHTTWVSRNEPAHRRMEKFLQNLHHLNLIGDFHSHTRRKGHSALCRLSSADKQGLLYNDVCIVIALNPRQKYQPWKTNRDGTLSGTIDEHYMKIGAWHHNGKNGHSNSNRAIIVCPFAAGFEWN